MTGRPLAYYPQLDALRAIAVLMVLLSHYLIGGPWGDYGVRLFFVLSGFLITSTLVAHREHMRDTGVSVGVVARNFYVRRSLRLFPVFYLALLAYWVMVDVLHIATIDTRMDWLFHAGYLTNLLVFLRGEWLGALSPYWSLAVEEQFYIVWFWVVLYVPARWLPATVGLVVAAAPVFRGLTYAAGENLYADVLLPACVDTLGAGAGALLALAVRQPAEGQSAAFSAWVERHASLVRCAVAGLAVALLICSFGADKNSLVRRLMVNLLSSTVFVYVVFVCYRGAGGPLGRLLLHPWLIAIGKFSYGVYVYHMLVLMLCRAYLAPVVRTLLGQTEPSLLSHAVEFVIPAMLTLLLARLSWFHFERPILRLKDRFSEGLGSA